VGDGPELDRERLAAVLEAARGAWPGVVIDDAVFADYLRARLEGGATLALASDLYLACACARGDQAAITIFLREMVPHIEAAVLGLGADPAQVDEVRSQLCDALLVGSPPGITTYAGRGQLRSWVRSIAVRMAMRHLGRNRAAAGSDDVLASLAADADDPEIEHLKTRYGAAFRTAFAEALAALTPRQRNLLRQHYLDELTVDQLGALYRVHRATAARWVAAARQALFDDTRRRMIDGLGLPASEYDSLVRLLHSQLDLSIQRHLSSC
jgi:RNA polymerase sigma-70 factor, ECF subfamily